MNSNKTPYKKFYIPFEKNLRHKEQPKVHQINGSDEYSIGLSLTKFLILGKNKQKLYDLSTRTGYFNKEIHIHQHGKHFGSVKRPFKLFSFKEHVKIEMGQFHGTITASGELANYNFSILCNGELALQVYFDPASNKHYRYIDLYEKDHEQMWIAIMFAVNFVYTKSSSSD